MESCLLKDKKIIFFFLDKILTNKNNYYEKNITRFKPMTIYSIEILWKKN